MRFLKLNRQRILISFVVGALSTFAVIRLGASIDGNLADMGWALNAARDLLAGRDPYRHEPSMFLVPYPLTAAIIVFPWAFFPGKSGVALLFGGTSALLSYILIQDNQYWRLIIFVSPAYIMALKSIQWSPLFLLASFVPVFAPILLAKPTLALPAALLMKWTPLGLLMTIIVGGIPFLIMPDWFWRWIEQVASYDGFIPLLSWFGPVFLISALFWRKVEARLFIAMNLVPQHRFFYDQLLLWTIPQTKRQMIALTIFSWIGFCLILMNFRTLWVDEIYLLATTYLPAFLIILWQQPIIRQYCRTLAEVVVPKMYNHARTQHNEMEPSSSSENREKKDVHCWSKGHASTLVDVLREERK